MAKNRAVEVGTEEGGEVEEPPKTGGSGNLGLPFGLCAKYGIALPRNATPRDAWNALKKRGINPPWTKEGKKQYDGKGSDDVVDKPTNAPEEKKQEEKPKDELEAKKEAAGYNKIDKKDIAEIGREINRYQYESNSRLSVRLRQWHDLNNLSDEELDNLITLFKDAINKRSDEWKYIKQGSKWAMTRYHELAELMGEKLYSEEDKIAEEENKNLKVLEKSQTPEDKRIQSLFGEGTQVCFGKGYSKESLQQIEKATETLTNEFGELKGYVKLIGDRNNLEKYLNAQKDTKKFTDSQINTEMENIRQLNIGHDIEESHLRNMALSNLRGRKIELIKRNNAYAYWYDTQKLMCFMGTMKKTSDVDIALEHAFNFKSSNKAISVYYHEMGHAIDHMLNKMFSDKMHNALGKPETYNPLAELQRAYNKQKQELIAQNYNKETGKWNLSKYGATNDDEFVAESFGAHYTDMNNELATKCVNLIKETIEKLRGMN